MIHIYPGMGATADMYGPLWRECIGGVYHNWPEWSGESSIREIACTIVERDGIRDGDQIIGTSLGGMVACEIGKLRKIDLVVLIASAVNQDEIEDFLRTIHPLVDIAPLSFVRACAGKIPAELMQMFSETDPRFIRAMVKAVFKWNGICSTTPIFRIHGTSDRVIPEPRAKVDCLIEGGHLLVMTHAKECIECLLANKSVSSALTGCD